MNELAGCLITAAAIVAGCILIEAAAGGGWLWVWRCVALVVVTGVVWWQRHAPL